MQVNCYIRSWPTEQIVHVYLVTMSQSRHSQSCVQATTRIRHRTVQVTHILWMYITSVGIIQTNVQCVMPHSHCSERTLDIVPKNIFTLSIQQQFKLAKKSRGEANLNSCSKVFLSCLAGLAALLQDISSTIACSSFSLLYSFVPIYSVENCKSD